MVSPLEEFQQEHKERWSVLQDIPKWEEDSILEWAGKIFSPSGGTLRADVVRKIERQTRLDFAQDLSLDSSSWIGMSSSLRQLLRLGRYREVLVFLDCTVRYVGDWGVDSDGDVLYGYGHRAFDDILDELEMYLSNGSKWVIAQGGAGLVERVDEHLTQVARDLENNHLTKAWNEAFAVNPKPDRAIESAQKALEQIASEKGLTKAQTQVYGTLLGDIRANPARYSSSAKEAYDLMEKVGRDPRATMTINERFSNWFWEGMDLVQKTNPGRHSSEQTKNFVLSDEAGKQAVLIATLLCNFIDAGYFKKT